MAVPTPIPPTQPEQRPPALELREIRASYREGTQRLPVIGSFSLTVAHGEFVAIIGPSGSGKSTLLDIVSGLLEPDAGEVWLNGRPLTAAGRRGRSAYMRQRDLLLPWRDVIGNAGLALEVAGVGRKEIRQRVESRLAEFGLAGSERRYPSQLSGGMRQRVALLRTFLSDAGLLLLDEPLGALDALTRTSMQDWLGERLLAAPRSAVLVTHDIEEALFLADRVIVISHRPAEIVLALPVTFERPRSRSVVTTPDFVESKARIMAALGLVQTSSAGV